MYQSIRLNAALDWIEEDSILADVGCDHGYLAIAALNKGAAFVQLIDNKEGPLSVAEGNLKSFNKNKYCLTLASGLTKLNNDVDTVAILGMGGELIIRIFEEGKNNCSNVKKFILEANTKIPSLRKYLFDNGYKIIMEKIVKENNKYYELLLVEKNENLIIYDEEDLMFGPYLKKEKSPLFVEKWTKIYNEYNEIMNKNNSRPDKMVKECKMMEVILCLK